MTCEELIALLSTFPPDYPVLVDGYEDGFDEVTGGKTVCFVPHQSDEWFYGCFEKAKDGRNAVALRSTRR